MKVNNLFIATLICTAMIMLWHVSPLATPEIIPDIDHPDIPKPYGLPPVEIGECIK